MVDDAESTEDPMAFLPTDPAGAAETLRIANSPARGNRSIVAGVYCDVAPEKQWEFEAVGNARTALFTLEPGVVVAEVKYQGVGPLSVVLWSETHGFKSSGTTTKNYASVLADGPFQGVLVEPVFEGGGRAFIPGAHRFEVTSDGPWTLVVSQPSCDGFAASDPAGVRLSGSDHTVYGPIRFGGGSDPTRAIQYTFGLSHDNSGFFGVELIGITGRTGQGLVGFFGSVYEGAVAITIGPEEHLIPGAYFLAFKGSGNWTADIRGIVS